MRTAIVILNWNTKGYLERYLPSVIGTTEGLADVIVADSASTDGSLTLVAEKFPSLRPLPLSENLGYAGGYNAALSTLRLSPEGKDYEYYILLNTDIQVPQGWLQPLLRWMDEHPHCGACAPKILSMSDPQSFEYAGAAGGFIDGYGYPFCRGRILGKVEKDEGQYDGLHEVLWASGACLMIRAGLFHELGGFDGRFFAHMEEIDLCWRLKLRGEKVNVVTDSRIFHIGGGSLPQGSPRKLKLNFRNSLWMLENNLPRHFALAQYRNTSNAQRAARKALRKTSRRLLTRQLLDGLSAAVYAVTFKWPNVRAVWEAHKEFKAGRRLPSEAELTEYLAQYGKIADSTGVYPHWIIPLALLGLTPKMDEK